ncbi:zinc finger lsd1 subclass family protein (macronuclear) [Tetrahymena thermophila SB210]|uniref:Zinc finger lsd1 subclass family protein n=1 Tax=Tetrahymena thermophila (strain SB210) TaxID=312017 RepID=Q22XV6_TETTS|nr:zinc finger lsd1 subclass family protein [Tetrahymena thermophila SB210]EAR90268.2 zinc finger lsd1 subclass family protein [Tetrahymena thermophila SB210]|eukprot:XP_001010513.2 zinc finger lsd1 subclass family protein [Tetrahymena thermophila SB210]
MVIKFIQKFLFVILIQQIQKSFSTIITKAIQTDLKEASCVASLTDTRSQIGYLLNDLLDNPQQYNYKALGISMWFYYTATQTSPNYSSIFGLSHDFKQPLQNSKSVLQFWIYLQATSNQLLFESLYFQQSQGFPYTKIAQSQSSFMNVWRKAIIVYQPIQKKAYLRIQDQNKQNNLDFSLDLSSLKNYIIHFQSDGINPNNNVWLNLDHGTQDPAFTNSCSKQKYAMFHYSNDEEFSIQEIQNIYFDYYSFQGYSPFYYFPLKRYSNSQISDQTQAFSRYKNLYMPSISEAVIGSQNSNQLSFKIDSNDYNLYIPQLTPGQTLSFNLIQATYQFVVSFVLEYGNLSNGITLISSGTQLSIQAIVSQSQNILQVLLNGQAQIQTWVLGQTGSIHTFLIKFGSSLASTSITYFVDGNQINNFIFNSSQMSFSSFQIGSQTKPSNQPQDADIFQIRDFYLFPNADAKKSSDYASEPEFQLQNCNLYAQFNYNSAYCLSCASGYVYQFQGSCSQTQAGSVSDGLTQQSNSFYGDSVGQIVESSLNPQTQPLTYFYQRQDNNFDFLILGYFQLQQWNDKQLSTSLIYLQVNQTNSYYFLNLYLESSTKVTLKMTLDSANLVCSVSITYSSSLLNQWTLLGIGYQTSSASAYLVYQDIYSSLILQQQVLQCTGNVSVGSDTNQFIVCLGCLIPNPTLYSQFVGNIKKVKFIEKFEGYQNIGNYVYYDQDVMEYSAINLNYQNINSLLDLFSLSLPGLSFACQSGYYFFEGVCIKNCNSVFRQSQLGQFNALYQSTISCEMCPSNCLSCTSFNVCTSCRVGYILKANQCVTCNSGYSYDTVSQQCKQVCPSITDQMNGICVQQLDTYIHKSLPLLNMQWTTNNDGFQILNSDNTSQPDNFIKCTNGIPYQFFSFYGGYLLTSTNKIQRTWMNLPNNYYKVVSFYAVLYGDTPTDSSLKVTLNGQQTSSTVFNIIQSGANICNTSNNAQKQTIIFLQYEIMDNANQLILTVQPSNNGIAIRNVNLLVKKCHSSCYSCKDGPNPWNCILCQSKNNMRVDSQCICQLGEYYKYQGCYSSPCYDCVKCVSPNCQVCEDETGNCLVCNSGYVQQQGNCVQICDKTQFYFNYSPAQVCYVQNTLALDSFQQSRIISNLEFWSESTNYLAQGQSLLSCLNMTMLPNLGNNAGTNEQFSLNINLPQFKSNYKGFQFNTQLAILDNMTLSYDYILFQYQGTTVQKKTFGIFSNTTNSCANPKFSDSLQNFIFSVYSGIGTINLNIVSNFQNDKSNASFSLGEFKAYYILNEPLCASYSYPQNNANPTCQTCAPNAKLTNNACACNDGYYFKYIPSKLDGICLPCNPACSRCSGPSVYSCSTCQTGYFYDGQRCIKSCSEGFYQNSTNNCAPCGPNCFGCTGPKDYQCTSCQIGKYLYINKCYSDCKTADSKAVVDNWSRSCIIPQNQPGQLLFSTSDQFDPSILLQYKISSGLNSNTIYQCQQSSMLGLYSQTMSMFMQQISPHSILLFNFQLYLNVDCSSGCKLTVTIQELQKSQSYSISSPKVDCTPQSTLSQQLILQDIQNSSQDYTFVIGVTGSEFAVSNIQITPITCHVSCLYCTGPLSNQCTQCYPGSAIQGQGSVGSCICQDKLLGLGLSTTICSDPQGCMTCQQCMLPCLSCYKNDALSCLTCSQGKSLFVSTCVDSCPPDISIPSLDSNNNNICSPCPIPCQTCDLKSRCTSCISGYLFIADQQLCVTQCPDGYFQPSDTSNYCQRCGDICKTCTQSSNNCLSCIDGYYFSQDPVLGNQCNICDSRCQTCTGPSNTQCINCSTQPGVVLFKPQNIEYCSNTCDEVQGYYLGYDQSQNLKCINCAPNCSGCNSLNPDTCTSCFQGYTIIEGICSACDSSCYNCNGITKYNCIQCSNQLYLLNNQCIQQCPQGYFSQSEIISGVQINTCIQCPSSCVSCTSLTSCNLCNLGYFLTNQQCLQCKNNCQVCFGTNGSLCQKCYLGYFLQNQKCTDTCQSVNGIGFYGEISTKTCLQCDLSCLTCINKFPYTCTSCFDGFYLYAPKPINSGSSSSNTQKVIFGTCNSCPKESKTCYFDQTLNLVQSSSCNQGYFLYSNACITNCPQGYFANKNTNVCVICNQACKQCQDSTVNQCSSCTDGFVLTQPSSCLPCSQFLNGCLVCSSQTNCLKCGQNLILYQGQCISTCDQSKGLYTFNNQCKNCVSPCIQCTSATNCILCGDGFILSGSACVPCNQQCQTCNGTSDHNCSTCRIGFYLQPVNQVQAICTLFCNSGYYANKLLGSCVQCDQSCSECADQVSCSKCNNGYYQISGQPLCSQCKATCLTCTALTMCTSCVAGTFLSNNDCVPVCPKGQFGSNGLCIPCDSNCDSCSSNSTKCQSCQIGYYLNNSNVCIQCSQNCLQCSSASACLKCAFGTFLENGSCKSSCSNPNSYQDKSLNQCVLCDSSCQTCNGSSSRNCLSCYNGYYFSVLNSPSGICVQCDSSCSLCTGPSNNECQQCKKGVQYKPPSSCIACPVSQYFDGSQCQYCSNLCLTCFDSSANSCLSCKQNYFLDINTNTCQSCPQTCLTCVSSTYCTLCEPGYFLLNNLQCVTQCPVGMRADVNSGVCMCDVTCGKCNYNPTQNLTTCQKCINSDYLLNGNNAVCIQASQCQGYQDLLNGACVQNCPPQATYIDLDVKSCSNNPCLSNQFIQNINNILYCSTSCPPSFYKEMQTKYCLPCDFKCQTCTGPSDSQCQVCQNNNYYHPEIQTCKDQCLPGYIQLDQTQKVCTACLLNCKICVPSLILFEGNCITECPVGYQQVLQSCKYAPLAVVKISNVQNGQVISINADFEVQSTLYATQEIQNVVWSITKSLDKKFASDFSQISSASLSQVIPFIILTPSNNFIMQVTVTLKDGTVISDKVNLLTSDTMHEGQFIVDKTQGVSYNDTFAFQINNWSFTEQLYFDLNFYQLSGIQQVNITSNSSSQMDFVKDELFQLYEQIAINGSLTISYQFQPFSSQVNIVCELKVYTKDTSVQSFKYLMINLQQYPGKVNDYDLLNDQLNQVSSTSDPNLLQQLLFKYSHLLKFMVQKDQAKLAKLNQQINLRQVAQLNGVSSQDLPSCDSTIDCFSQGQCTNNPLYQQGCFCTSGFYGINCEWDSHQYQIITQSFQQISNILSSKQLSPIIQFQIIENLSVYFNMFYLNFSSLSTLLNMHQSIINQYLSNNIDQVKGQILQRSLSVVTSQLKQMDQDSTSLINMGYNLHNKVSSNLNVGEKLITSSDASSSVSYPYLLQKLSSDQSNKLRRLIRLRQLDDSSNVGLPVVFGSLTVQFPPEVIQTNKKQVIQATSWNQNPRSNPLAITQCISLSVSSGGQETSVNNLSQPITITIPKSIPSPVSSDPSSISCTYYDEATNSWKTDGCTFVKETILNIICSCTHLTDFTGQKAQVQGNASSKLAEITSTVILGNSLLQQSSSQKVVINQLPVLQIGQRSVNLVNQLNILQSGSAVNFVKKNTILLIENQYYTEDVSEFWEQDQITIKNQNNQNQQEIAEGQVVNNLQIIFYVLIAFNISFYLIMRAQFRFKYIKVDFKQIKMFELKQNKIESQVETNQVENKRRKNKPRLTVISQNNFLKRGNKLKERRNAYIQNLRAEQKQSNIEQISEDIQKQYKPTSQTSILSIENDSQNQINQTLSNQYNLPSAKSIYYISSQQQINQTKNSTSQHSLDDDIEKQKKHDHPKLFNDSSKDLHSDTNTRISSNYRNSRFNLARREEQSEKLITIIDEEEFEINSENDEQYKLNDKTKKPLITAKPNQKDTKKKFHSMKVFLNEGEQEYENHIQDQKEKSTNPREQSLNNLQRVSKLIKKLKRNYEMLNGNNVPSFNSLEVLSIQNKLTQQKKILSDQDAKDKKVEESKNRNFYETLEQKISQNKGFKFLNSIQKQEEAEEQLTIIMSFQENLSNMIQEKNIDTEQLYKIENNEFLILIKEEIQLPFEVQQIFELKQQKQYEQQYINKIKKNSKKVKSDAEENKLKEMNLILKRIDQEIESKQRIIKLMKNIINQQLQINSLSIFQFYSLCTYYDRLFSNRQTKSIYFSCQLVLAIFTNIVYNSYLNQYFEINTQFGIFDLYLYRILVTVAISHAIPYFFFGMLTNIFASSSKRINKMQSLDFNTINSLRKDFMIYYIVIGFLQMASCLGGIYFYSLNQTLLNSFSLSYHVAEVFISLLISGVFIDGIFFLAYLYLLSPQEKLEDGILNKIIACRGFYYYKGFDSLEIYKQYYFSIIMEDY